MCLTPHLLDFDSDGAGASPQPLRYIQGYSNDQIYMGWVNSELQSSPGWWVATVATFCPSRLVQHPKSKSTQPMYLIV